MRTQQKQQPKKSRKNPHNVQIGQVWESLDPRRQVKGRVVEIDVKHGLAKLKYFGSNRSGTVPLDRFNSDTKKGYRLLPAVEPAPAPKSAEGFATSFESPKTAPTAAPEHQPGHAGQEAAASDSEE